MQQAGGAVDMQQAAGAVDMQQAAGAVNMQQRAVCAAEQCQVAVPEDKRMRCSRCKSVWYCTKACQHSAWAQHKKNCNRSTPSFPATRTGQQNRQYVPLEQLPAHTPTAHYAVVAADLQVYKDLYNACKWSKIRRLETKMLTHAQTALDGDMTSEVACIIYHITGAAHYQMHDLHQALPMFEKALQTINDAGDSARRIFAVLTQMRVYEDLGLLCLILGRAKEALPLFRKVFFLSDDKRCTTTCSALRMMAICYVLMGRYRKAITTLQSACEIALELGDVQLQLKCTTCMAKAHTSLKEYQLAEDAYAHAGKLLKNIQGLSKNKALAYLMPLNMAYATSEWCRARLAEKEVCDRQVPRSSPEYTQMVTNCNDYLQGEYEMLKSVVGHSDDIADAGDEMDIVANAHLTLAYLLHRVGKAEEAMGHLHSCLDVLVAEGVFACAFCSQRREHDDTMLCCSVCHVSRFCNVECQTQAYKKSMMACSTMVVPHRKLCPLLREWKQVKRRRQTAHSCSPMFVAFLADCYPFQELCTRNLDDVD